MTFDRVIITLMGFTQDWATPTGMEKSWLGLRDLSSRDTLIATPMPWDANVEALAALIDRNAAPGAEIYIQGYSWGGMTAVLLAEELGRRGRCVAGLGLCDAVYRARSVLGWGRSLRNRILSPMIRIPRNVRRVVWTRQTGGKPMGHQLKAEDPAATVIDDCLVRPFPHTGMDDDAVFHQMFLGLLMRVKT